VRSSENGGARELREWEAGADSGLDPLQLTIALRFSADSPAKMWKGFDRELSHLHLCNTGGKGGPQFGPLDWTSSSDHAGVEKKGGYSGITLFKLLKRRISQNAADQIVEEGEERERKKKKSCNAVSWHAEDFLLSEKKELCKARTGIIGSVTHKGFLCLQAEIVAGDIYNQATVTYKLDST